MDRIHIQRVLDYIEKHLKEDLDNLTLAKVAGYSEYHFLRKFRKNIGLTPADYIRKRRISEIVCRIGEKDCAISDIAFEYGFNSKENFTRAFKKEHSILPTEFKSADCSLRLFRPFTFDRNELQTAVSLMVLEDFTLIAYVFEDDFPPNCWNRYNTERRNAKLSGGKASEDFGAMVWDTEKSCLRYFIGIRSEDAAGDLSDTVRLDISGGIYAVFETEASSQHEFVNTVRRTWKWIYSEWLPENGYVRAEGFEFERYFEDGKKYTEKIYIPIKKEQ